MPDEFIDGAVLQRQWLACMEAGDFPGAWRLSAQARGRRLGFAPGLPRHHQSVWAGTPVDDRHVLVRCYHGLGDTIQFARYLPLLAARARSVAVWAQAELLPLLTQSLPGLRLLPLHDGTPDIEFEVDVELMELPWVFDTSLDTIPAKVPYLRAAPSAAVRSRGPAVGLFWRAGEWAPHRSLTRAVLDPLLELPVTWHSLQLDVRDEEFPRGAIQAAIPDLTATAGILRGLDLVIGVDSMLAHLAGSLALPVWTMLPANADWRWLRGRLDSPWYPTMRLFRQSVPGHWSDVVADVSVALQRWLDSRASHPPLRQDVHRMAEAPATSAM